MAYLTFYGGGFTTSSRGWIAGGIAGWLSPAVAQALLVTALVALTNILSLAGSGLIARVAFIGGAMGLALFYWRRSPWLYLTAVFWFWTLAPLVRRLINLHTGFNPTDLVLATPNIMSVFVAFDLLSSSRMFKRPETLGPFGVVVCVLYGFAVSLINGQIYIGAIGAMDWLLPVLYFLFILEHMDRIDSAVRDLRMFLILNGCVTTAYALLQVWQPPAWDVAWALNSGTDNAVTVETQWRVFGTLNSVGVFAPWMVTLLVLSLHFRGILSVVILPAAGLLLLLTGVRSALVSLLLSLGVAAAIGGWRISGGLLSLGTAMIMLGLAFGSFNPDVADRLVMRYGSLTELQYDDSALTRAEIWRHTPEMIDSHPYGMGLGAIGRGAVVASNFDFVSIDFGVLAIYLSLGWVAGTIYIFSMVAAVATGVWHALRSKDPAAVVCAAASVGIVSLLPIANVVGFQGATLWLSAGLATALGMRSDRQRKAAVSLGQVCLGPSRRIRAQQEP